MLKRTTRISIIAIICIITAAYIAAFIQTRHNYKIVTYGDSITASFKWQPYLEKEFDQKILNLGIGSTCLARKGREPGILTSTNVFLGGYDGDKWQYIKSVAIGFGFRLLKKYDFTTLLPHKISNARMDSQERLSTIPNSVETILIMGGTNDAIREYKDQDIEKSLYTIYKSIKQKNSNVRIVILTPPHNSYEESEDYSHRMDNLRMLLHKFSIEHNIQCIHMEDCGINLQNINTYTIDGVHPNEHGGKVMGDFIINEMKRGRI